jgi:hypothetical protein
LKPLFAILAAYGLSSSLLCCATLPLGAVDLTKAVVVTRPGLLPKAEKTAAVVLVEELERRTGIKLPTSTQWPSGKPVIAITSEANVPGWKVPIRDGQGLPEKRPEGYRLYAEANGPSMTLWVIGGDPRGVLFGVGQLLRKLDFSRGKLSLQSPLDIASSPAYSIRGHQLGYRAQANSYDAWDVPQFEQYIRELTFFGVNSIEGIPFQDERPTPVMKTPRREMNRAIGEICDRYGLDYWAWIPADFDLKDTARRTSLLDRCDEFFKDTPQLTGIFFPGGDPGHNPPELVLPFLEDMAKRMLPRHPAARIWISLQWFTPAQVDAMYQYIEREKPAWFAGLVAGPSSPPIAETRRRLPAQYKLRSYPDITHNKISQYQVPSWDQAFALTLGREAINPRPAEYAAIHNRFAPYTDGFISYSDGVHDDVNKTIFSALSWDPQRSVRDILVDYAHVYFQPSIAGDTADAILALERNWRGPLVDNGAVEGTLLSWQKLEKQAPELEANWRWQMCLLRANYDAYIRSRLINETKLEDDANAILADAARRGADAAMTEGMEVLNRVQTHPVSPDLRARIVDLCDRLFHSIGLQTSVEKYHAINEERGAVLDFVDYPLNNRWWLEDEFKKIRALSSEKEKDRRLYTIATWEHPGPGSFYDDIGNIANSPHVVRSRVESDHKLQREPEPTFWWWDQGKSRARLSWQTTMWPIAVEYEALDPNSKYVVRSTGYGQALLRIDGERVSPVIDGKQMGEFKEFAVPAACLKDGKLVLTWDRPTDEGRLNWRQKSRLAEVWLLKQNPNQAHAAE